MKRIICAVYEEPVVFLALVQAVATVLAGLQLVTAWIPVVTLAGVAALQRHLVKPEHRVRGGE
jgi:hypothetical protein